MARSRSKAVAGAGLLVVTVLAGALPQPPPPRGVRFGDPRPVALLGYDGDAMEPFVTRDGRYLLFNNRNDPSIDTNLHYAERIDDDRWRYRGELRGVRTPALEGVPSVSADGILYFVSPRSYEETFSTIYRGRFRDGVVTDVELVPGVSRREPGIVNFDVEVSFDGATLYFVDARFRPGQGPVTADLVIAHRSEDGTFVRDPRSKAILAAVNTADALEYAAAVDATERELFFTRFAPASGAPPAVYVSRRAAKGLAFGPPRRLEEPRGFVEAPALSPDGQSLYVHRRERRGFRLYRVRRLPER